MDPTINLNAVSIQRIVKRIEGDYRQRMHGNEHRMIACAKRFSLIPSSLLHCDHRVAEAKKYTADVFLRNIGFPWRHGSKTPLKKKPLVVSTGLSTLLDSYTHHGRILNWLPYNRRTRADYVACRMWRIFFGYIFCCFRHERLSFYNNLQNSPNSSGWFITDNYKLTEILKKNLSWIIHIFKRF